MKPKAVNTLDSKQKTRRKEHDDSVKMSKQIVYLDCEILDDGTHRQFTQIGCYTKQRGIGRHFFVSILPDNLEKYERYKQSVNLLTLLRLTYDEQRKEYFFRKNSRIIKPEKNQTEAISKGRVQKKIVEFSTKRPLVEKKIKKRKMIYAP